VYRPGQNAWPITGASYLVSHAATATTTAVREFLDWAYREGDQTATHLHYLPLQATLKYTVRASWK
jgi:phosphate transport system substrate-binding protein